MIEPKYCLKMKSISQISRSKFDKIVKDSYQTH